MTDKKGNVSITDNYFHKDLFTFIIQLIFITINLINIVIKFTIRMYTSQKHSYFTIIIQ